MGKIRVKTLGDESQEQEEKKKLKEKREAKKVAKAPGLKGGERVVAVGPSADELETQPEVVETAQNKGKTKKAKFEKKKTQSKKHHHNLSLVGKNTKYPLEKAVSLLKSFKNGKFDETVELHVNVKGKGIAGVVTLPHGTGKKIQVRVAEPETVDALVAEIEKGKIDFDVLVAHPSIMQKLAKVARILGPRGLMPNPKNGTISPKPEEVVEKLSKGQVNYKTETGAPIIHLSVGKASFEEKQIQENVKSVLSSIGATKIVSATLKSTMSPGIKLSIESF